MWQHSCSFSLGRQVSLAATEVYFISSALSHFICHPPYFSSDKTLLQTFPPTIPFTSCPLAPVFASLYFHFSFTYTDMIQQCFLPPLTLITILFKCFPIVPLLLLLLQPQKRPASARNTLSGSAQKHTARPQKPNSKMASPPKYFSNETQTSSVTLSVRTSVDATCVKHVKIARKI